MKTIYIATVVKTHIKEFHIPFLKMFEDMGCKTAVAARNDYEVPRDCIIPYCDTYFDVPFERNPFMPGNIKAYKQLKTILDDGEYDIIHCHTPVGAFLGRLAARASRKKGSRVFYTAHGFHFYKGAPLKNWLLYYPVEWICSFWTDTLITINKEDYELAKKHMHARQVEYIPGVGIDVKRFAETKIDRAAKRRELGVPEDAALLISAGELNDNKNHATVIRALAEIRDNTIHYAIAGAGSLREILAELASELGISERIHLLGYRRDVAELYHAADIFVFPSKREGLPVSVMEAMASGLPIIASDIRGSRDLLEGSDNILVSRYDDISAYTEAIRTLAEDEARRMAVGLANSTRATAYDISIIIETMQRIYGL